MNTRHYTLPIRLPATLHDNAKAVALKKNTTLSKLLDTAMRNVRLSTIISALEHRIPAGYVDEPLSRKTTATVSPDALDSVEDLANRLGLSKDLILRLALENAVTHN